MDELPAEAMSLIGSTIAMSSAGEVTWLALDQWRCS